MMSDVKMGWSKPGVEGLLGVGIISPCRDSG